MEKGTVHLYLVAKTEILDSEEITVTHDMKNPLPCPYEGCPHMKNRDSGRTGLASTIQANLSPIEMDRKRRRRRTNSTAGEASSPSATPQIPVEPSIVAPVPVTPPAPAAPPSTPIKRSQRPSSKLAVTCPVPDGEDSQDGSGNLDETDCHVASSTEQEFSSHKKRKMVNIKDMTLHQIRLFNL